MPTRLNDAARLTREIRETGKLSGRSVVRRIDITVFLRGRVALRGDFPAGVREKLCHAGGMPMLTIQKRDAHLYARLFGCLLAGALSMLAFTLSPEGYAGVSDPPLRAGSPVWILDALMLGGLYVLATRRDLPRFSAGMAAFGLLFGGVNFFATTLFAYDSWAFLNGGRAWGAALACIVGQGAAMAAGFRVLCGALETPMTRAEMNGNAEGGNTAVFLTRGHARLTDWLRRGQRRFPRLTAACRRHPTRAAILVLLLCWSPFLLAFYPGTIIWDMGEMLGSLYGLRELSTWHPIFTTWLFGGCVWLGRLAGSDNLGAFLFTMLQTMALAFALADSLRLMRGLGVSWLGRAAALAFFGLTPIFGSFAQAVGKDTLYVAALMVFTVRLTETVRFNEPLRRGHGWMLGVAGLLSCLVRTNGLYVVAGASAAAVAFGLRGRMRLRVGGVLAAALAAALLFTHGLVPTLGVKDETASGLYSVCFQQSARTLRDHADTVTPEEISEIDRVLDAEALPTLYEANISDPVKYTFRQYGQGREAETVALTRYRATWLKMLGEYPLTYLEAFVAGNSGYYAFTPKIDAARTFNYQGGIRFVFETYELGDDPRYLHTTQISALAGVRTALAAYARGWRRVPVLEWFLFCPVYTWLLIAAGFSLARQRRWRLLTAFVPALLSVGVCLLSPVNDYFRYFLPVVAMTPLLLALSRKRANDGSRA